MADRQLAESSNATSAVKPQSKTSPDIVADWLIVYAKVYREEVQEELVVAYLEALKKLRPELLHHAFLRAMKLSRFRPTPAEVRESYEILAGQVLPGNRPGYLDEPKMSEQDRNAALADPQYQALRGKIIAHGPKCLCGSCRTRRERQP